MTLDHPSTLAERQLPSPGGAVQRLLQLLGNEDATTQDIAQALEADPAMTGRVVRLANSAIYGGRVKVANVKDALRRIGLNSLRQVLVTFSLVDRYRDGHCPDFDYQAFWAQSLATGILTQHLAALERLPAPGDAFTMGLLSRIGELALATLHPEDYGSLHAGLARAGAHDIRQAERGRYSYDRFQLAERLLQEWALPETLAQAVRGSAAPESAGLLPQSMAMRLARLLQISMLLGRCFECGDRAPSGDMQHIRELCAAARIPEEELNALLPSIILEWREWAAMLGLIVQGTGPVTLDVPQAAEVIPFPGVTVMPVTPEQTGTDAGSAGNPAPRTEAFVAAVARLQRGLEGAEDPKTSASPADAPPSPSVVPASSLRILLAMAEGQTRTRLTDLLQSQGHVLRHAARGDEALAMILREVPQVVLGDLALGEGEGLALFQKLREFSPLSELYLMACGPRDVPGALEAAFAAGADDFLATPVRAGELLARLRAARRFIDIQVRWRADHAEMRRLASELTVLNGQLEAAAETDPLTGIANRRRATDRLAEAVRQADLAARPLSVFLIDLDHFKAINDRCGHAIGDQVLCLAARTLQACARGRDVVARFGGEEFVVVAPGIDAQDASGLAERMRAAVSRLRVDGPGGEVSLTASVGVSVYQPRPGVRPRSPEGLLHLADEALYRAKNTGRNRVCIAAERQAVVW